MSEEIAAKEAIVYCRTDTTTPDAEDQVDGLTSVEVNPEFTTVDTTYIGKAYETMKPTTKKIGFTLAGNRKPADAPQALLFAAFEEGSIVYVTIHDNPAASAGSKGKRYPVYISAGPQTLEPTALQPFNFTGVLADAPTAV